MQQEKTLALGRICEEEKLDREQFSALMESYIYSNQEPIRDDILQCLGDRPSVLQASFKERILDRMRDFVSTFVEDGGITKRRMYSSCTTQLDALTNGGGSLDPMGLYAIADHGNDVGAWCEGTDEQPQVSHGKRLRCRSMPGDVRRDTDQVDSSHTWRWNFIWSLGGFTSFGSRGRDCRIARH